MHTIQFIIAFLIFFPFLSAILLVFMKKPSIARAAVVIVSAITIMIAVITMAVLVLSNGTHRTYLTEAKIPNLAIMLGEIFLMCLVIYYGIKYKKYYVILLSAGQTLPILWLDLSGRGIEGQTHLRIDNLTVLMCLVVGIVGSLICVYAIGYIKDYHIHHTEYKDRSAWFLAMLFVFLGAMFGLLLSDDLSWIYFFWEITSVCSFLLIGYNKQKPSIRNSFKALWMNLLGGCGFAGAIFYCTLVLGISDLSQLVTMDSSVTPGVMIPVTLLAFAALTKSAQMPFVGWLLGAMVAPTPTSALLHSATMVKAGVYLLIRLAPMMSGTLTGVLVTSIGGFTFFVASLMAITTTDGKRVLAHSTISNLGLITACAGVGLPESVWAGVMLILFHSVSKSLMFLSVGAVENSTGSRNIEDMHGLIVRLPKLAIVMTIGICGMFLAPFGMLVSKWAALKSFVDSGSVWLVMFLVFGSASTLFYWGKWLGKIFAVLHKTHQIPDTVHKDEWASIIPLATLVVSMCFLFPLISTYLVQPVLSQMFNEQINAVIGTSDVAVMIMMLCLIALLPILVQIYAKIRRGYTDKQTMSYMGGSNAGDDRHFIDSFGNEKPIYMANWYMVDLFGEPKIMRPCLMISSAALIILMIVAMGGAI